MVHQHLTGSHENMLLPRLPRHRQPLLLATPLEVRFTSSNAADAIGGLSMMKRHWDRRHHRLVALLPASTHA